jgi:NAD(P)-dependent dehydrogenase (short-subunit alcohol dehydrogenase family)
MNKEARPVQIKLDDKTAVITGSSAGIGLAIAIGLAQAGAHVVVNGRNADRVRDAVAKVRAAAPGARVDGVAADVATAAGCDTLIAAFPKADILVNNTGIYEPKSFFEVDDADWSRFFDTNIMSGIRLSRHYLAGMLAANRGRVVFISSESAVQIPKEMIHYGVTKTAQLAISRGLAELTTGTNVTVNAVLPGPTHSDGADVFVRAIAAQTGSTPEAVAESFVRDLRPTSLLQRFARVEEVANMVVYVCSKQASATNGAALRVDGGVVQSIL